MKPSLKSRTISRFLGASALLFFGASFTSVALAEDLVVQPRVISAPFTAIRIEGPIDVSLSQGDATAVEVHARQSELGEITTEVRDGVLVISDRTRFRIQIGASTHKGPFVALTTKALTRIEVKGSGDVSAPSWTTTDDMAFSLTGSGDLRIDSFSARKIDVNVAGSSDVRLTGTVARQDVQIAGSGDYHAKNLRSDDTTISIAGSGDASIWAAKSLSISVAGSGDVEYFGRPKVTQSVAGSGDIRAMGERP